MKEKETSLNLMFPPEAEAENQNSFALLSPSSVHDLELEYLAGLICPYNQEYALKILSKPLTDIHIIEYRQDILDDFLNVPELEAILYKSIHTIYNNSKSIYAKIGSTQSFVEINENLEHMDSFIECINLCHTFYERHFSKLKSVGAKAVAEALEKKYRSEDFKGLVTEVTQLKETFTNGIRSVTLGINFDDHMRPVNIALLSASREYFREKTLFEKIFSRNEAVEPISEIYSRLSKDGELDAANKVLFKEIDSLTGDYVRHFNTALRSYYSSNVDFLLKLEPQINFYVGAARLVERMGKMGLPTCRPKILPMESRSFHCTDMYDIVFACKLFNSLLGGRNANTEIKTNDCEVNGIVILTGANNGGKTTFTRGAGINQVLAQCGMCVTAKSAEISPADSIFVHFPKEEEVGINTSRFTEECKEFKDTVGQAGAFSLVLMNESLSSTTPTECLIIAEELMKIFSYMGARVIYTTHIHELIEKKDEIDKAGGKSPMTSMIAQCDEKGQPTYRIVKGVPDSLRNARYIFERFGISFEEFLKQSEGEQSEKF